MIRLLALHLRRSVALWIAPVLVPLCWVIGRGGTPGWEYYGLSTAVHVLTVLVVLCPIAAGASAWDSARQRRSGFTEYSATASRSPLWAALYQCLAVLLLILIDYIVTLAASVSKFDASLGIPAPSILIFGTLVLAVHVALGNVIGRFAPRFTAPFIAIAVSWGWLIVLVISPTPWLRNLSLVSESNIALGQVFARNLLLGQVAVALSLIGLFAFLIEGQRLDTKSLKGLFVPAILLMAFALGAVLVSPYSSSSETVLRAAPSHPTCNIGHITVCVWPEDAVQLPTIVAPIDQIVSPLLGVPGISRNYVEYGINPPTPGSQVVIGAPSPGEPTTAYVAQLVGLLLPPFPKCGEVGSGNYSWPGLSVRALVGAWMLYHAGYVSDAFMELSPSDAKVLSSVVQQSQSRQLTWFTRNMAAQKQCTILPVLSA